MVPHRFSAEELAVAEREYARRNPQSRELYERAQRVMPGGNTRSALHFEPFPLYILRSSQATVVDADGHRYLDVLGEYTAGLYGHSDQRIIDAAVAAAASGVGNGGPGIHEIELAELVCGRFPSIERVRFCNSGTEANLYALSLARAATGRTKFLCFSGAYHGGIFVFADGGNPINAPYDWTVCRYNDIEGSRAAIEALGDQLAAVIVEPMMSNAGCIPATTAFLQTLRALCDKTGTALIFDEVVTSRHGASGLQGLCGVIPDLTTLGKYIGGGFSFGAFGGREGLMSLMDPGRPDSLPHAGTFNNNVFSMGAGAVALREVYTPARADQLYAAGEDLLLRLNEMCRTMVSGAQFTGIGSTMNIHFHRGAINSPEDLKNEPRDLKTLFHFDLMQAGVYAARRGQINLSLPMSSGDLATVVDGVRSFLTRRSPLIEALT
jgi:glutamate-1-semialdehyde 2,1-aminomutase